MLSYVIVTRDRHAELRHTLARVAALGVRAHDAIGGAEVLVVDNASRTPVLAPSAGAGVGGLPVRVLRSERNHGAAGRTLGVEAARGSWVLMLDDDSSPRDTAFVDALLEADEQTLAIAADVGLPGGRRESGGLPEVFIGCGVAIRRDAYLAVGGYDAGFEYYAEEYDLAAKLLMMGGGVVYDRRFRVEHRKTATNRDMNGILRRLIRNNSVVMQRYAPDAELAWLLRHTHERYRAIAEKENAQSGFARGVAEFASLRDTEQRTPMNDALWRRFTGEAAAMTGAARLRESGVSSARLTARGKHDWAVERALAEAGIRLLGDVDERLVVGPGPEHNAADAEAVVIGTLSPGPTLQAFASTNDHRGDRRARPTPVVALWTPGDDRGGGRRSAAEHADKRVA